MVVSVVHSWQVDVIDGVVNGDGIVGVHLYHQPQRVAEVGHRAVAALESLHHVIACGGEGDIESRVGSSLQRLVDIPACADVAIGLNLEMMCQPTQRHRVAPCVGVVAIHKKLILQVAQSHGGSVCITAGTRHAIKPCVEASLPVD